MKDWARVLDGLATLAVERAGVSDAREGRRVRYEGCGG